MSQKAPVAIVGGGPWGRALAVAARRAGSETWCFSRQPNLPDGVQRLSSIEEAGERARLIVVAVPSAAATEVARALGDGTGGEHLVVHAVRGFEGATLDTISDVIRRETPVRRVGALGGPVLAEDLTAGRPSVMVCGSYFPEVNAAVEAAFGSKGMRLYPTSDLRGLEWASALVGCLAIGIGYATELGMSAGLVSAVICRGIEEASRIAAEAGGDEKTLLGLAGYGDLLACLGQQERPEVVLGVALARGMSLREAMATAKLRVEAVELIPRIVTWTEARDVRAPIMAALARGVIGKQSPEDLVSELMQAPR